MVGKWVFPLGSEACFKTRVTTFSAIIQPGFEVLVMAITEEKEIKKIGKEVKWLFFGEDMIAYIENPKEATKKKKNLLELINEFISHMIPY